MSRTVKDLENCLSNLCLALDLNHHDVVRRHVHELWWIVEEMKESEEVVK